MKSMKNMAGALVAVALLSVALFADTGTAARAMTIRCRMQLHKS
ncbi:MAG: hypothetical protein ACM3ND_15735 [Acidobacteriota bacterium]